MMIHCHSYAVVAAAGGGKTQRKPTKTMRNGKDWKKFVADVVACIFVAAAVVAVDTIAKTMLLKMCCTNREGVEEGRQSVLLPD